MFENINKYKANKEEVIAMAEENEFLKQLQTGLPRPKIKQLNPEMISMKQMRAVRRGGSHV